MGDRKLRPFKIVKTKSWFEEFTNYHDEEAIRMTWNSPAYDAFGPHLRMQRKGTGTWLDCGRFRLWTLASLDQHKLVTKETCNFNKGCLFEIHIRQGEAYLPFVDVSALQAAAPPRTLVQVASNFNCCENASKYVDVTSNDFIRNLMVDSTQGPSASSGGITAAIYRSQFPHFPDIDPSQKNRPLNLLGGTEELTKHFPVDNGKAFMSKSASQWDESLVSVLMPQVAVGLHVDVPCFFARQVIGGPYVEEGSVVSYDLPEKGHPNIVDQVFVSAMNVKAPGVSVMNESERVSKMRFLLDCAYLGTYDCAVLRDSKELLLTCIGGGCFRNPLPMVAEALAKAHARYLTEHKGSLDRVVLPLFSDNSDPALFVDALMKVGVAHIKIVKHGF